MADKAEEIAQEAEEMTTEEMVAEVEASIADIELEPMNVYEALAWVQAELRAVGKNKKTSGNGPKYAFRSIDHVIQALHPLLGKAGILLVPQVLSFHTEDHRWSENKSEPMTVFQVRYRVIASDGSKLPKSLCPVMFAQGIDSGDKGPGKALSYAYKAAISQLFSIPTDDPAMDNEHRNGPPAAPAEWGHGWATKAEHDDFRSEMLALTRKVKDREGFDEIKAKLIDLGVLNDEGKPINPVTKDLMHQWNSVLSEFVHPPAEEASQEPEQDPKPRSAKKKPAKKKAPPDVQILRVLREADEPIDSMDVAALSEIDVSVVEAGLVALSMTGLAVADESGEVPLWTAVEPSGGEAK